MAADADAGPLRAVHHAGGVAADPGAVAALAPAYLPLIEAAGRKAVAAVPPPAAFERLWADRGGILIAGHEVAVPSVPAQALLLVLHAGRGLEWAGLEDVRVAWHDAAPDARTAVAALRDELDAGTAFAVAVGEDPDGDDRNLALWRSFAPGATRTQQWRARIAAAPDRRSALRLALSAALVNTDHLAMELGRPPTATDVLRAQARRVRRATGELRQAAVGRVRRRRG